MRRECIVIRRITRSGLSRIEVVVLVLIFTILVAVFLPAMLSTRFEVRRVECANNMKQLVLATLNWSIRHNRQFPDLYEDFTGKSCETARVPWTMSLLEDLDSRNVRRSFELSPRSVTDSTLSMKVFACPKDSNNFSVGGGLSYVANAGFMRDDSTDRRPIAEC